MHAAHIAHWSPDPRVRTAMRLRGLIVEEPYEKPKAHRVAPPDAHIPRNLRREKTQHPDGPPDELD